MMLDEIDKLGSDFRGDPAAPCWRSSTRRRTTRSRDHYLDVPFDLSDVLFIATANCMDPIPGPLRDRMEVIEISGYTADDKLQIAKTYLLPRQLEANGLRPDQVSFDDRRCRRSSTSYTREAGVRNLERELGAVAASVAASRRRGPARSDRSRTSTAPRRPRFDPEPPSGPAVPGVATGMAYTPVRRRRSCSSRPAASPRQAGTAP